MAELHSTWALAWLGSQQNNLHHNKSPITPQGSIIVVRIEIPLFGLQLIGKVFWYGSELFLTNTERPFINPHWGKGIREALRLNALLCRSDASKARCSQVQEWQECTEMEQWTQWSWREEKKQGISDKVGYWEIKGEWVTDWWEHRISKTLHYEWGKERLNVGEKQEINEHGEMEKPRRMNEEITNSEVRGGIWWLS